MLLSFWTSKNVAKWWFRLWFLPPVLHRWWHPNRGCFCELLACCGKALLPYLRMGVGERRSALCGIFEAGEEIGLGLHEEWWFIPPTLQLSEVSCRCYVALSFTHILVFGLPDNLPNTVECLTLSLGNPGMNTVLEVLSEEVFVCASICSSAVCFVSDDV